MKRLPAILILLALSPAFGNEVAPPADDKVVKLEPFKIRDNAIISFALDIAIYVEPDTKKATHVLITRVHSGTDAAQAGLQPGDEIVKLDGVPVKGMDSRVVKNSPLGHILLNREPGEPLKLEIITHRTQDFTLHAQRGSPQDAR